MMSKITSKALSKYARIEVLNMIYESKCAHIGSAFSCIDIVSVLYNEILNINKRLLNSNKRDIFILSKGHACSALYAVLALKGFFSKRILKSYGKNFSSLMSHASHKVPGVEFSTGSLGHGLPYAVGCALALKLSKNFKSRVFVLLSDGELNEGSNWEALMFASHHKLKNLTIVIDNNNLQSLTTIEKTLNTYPLKKKFLSFGLECETVDGHNFEKLKKLFLKKNKSLPKVIIAKTIKGKGIKEMENKVLWHYKPPTEEQFVKFKKEILI